MNTRGLTELIVLNIGLSLGVVSPLLFTMLVIMALITTFMTSPLLELTFPKRLIRQDLAEMAVQAEVPLRRGDPLYRILVPVANPNTQGGLVQLAAAIAGTNLQTSVVNPLSLIQLKEDYAFESMPIEAERHIAEQQIQLQNLVQSLEPNIRPLIHPIVRIANDICRETVEIAELEHADLILLGWHRPAFSNNRLGGRVGQILSTAKTDVAVFIDHYRDVQLEPILVEKLLVPYVAGIHNDLGLELAIRVLVNHPSSQLRVLRVTPPEQPVSEFSYEFRTVMQQLPNAIRDRITLSVVQSTDTIQTVIAASQDVDLTIAGASREWGIERQTLGQYTDELAVKCHSPLLILRCYSKVTTHLAALFDPVAPALGSTLSQDELTRNPLSQDQSGVRT